MKKFLLGCCAALLATASAAQPGYSPAPENIAARQRFSDNRFGIFLHWGLYAMLGQGEWVMNNLSIDRNEYANLAPQRIREPRGRFLSVALRREAVGHGVP